MISMTISRAIISNGYNNAPPLRYADSGKAVSFNVGIPKYDKNAPNETRWVNMKVKAFEPLVGRIKNMKLDAGYHVSITGEYDVEEWADSQTGEKRSAPALIIHSIEYNGSGNGKSNGSGGGSGGKKSNGNAPPPDDDPYDQGDYDVSGSDNDDFTDDDLI